MQPSLNWHRLVMHAAYVEGIPAAHAAAAQGTDWHF